MIFIFWIGSFSAMLLPFWWLRYGDIMKDVLAFKEAWWFGVWMWAVHLYVPFAIWFIATGQLK